MQGYIRSMGIVLQRDRPAAFAGSRRFRRSIEIVDMTPLSHTKDGLLRPNPRHVQLDSPAPLVEDGRYARSRRSQ
jgi:hypothetical protein